MDRCWFTPHTDSQLCHRLDSPLQEEEIGWVPLPYRLQGSKDLAAQQRILGMQQGGLQQMEGGQVLYRQTWRQRYIRRWRIEKVSVHLSCQSMF